RAAGDAGGIREAAQASPQAGRAHSGQVRGAGAEDQPGERQRDRRPRGEEPEGAPAADTGQAARGADRQAQEVAAASLTECRQVALEIADSWRNRPDVRFRPEEPTFSGREPGTA